MNFKKIYNKAFCVMQWGIGFCYGDIAEIIKKKKNPYSFKWLPLEDSNSSMADPFIVKGIDENLILFYEDFSMTDPSRYGKIVVATIDNAFNLINSKEVLDTKTHASYPFLFTENGITYVVPETSKQKTVTAYAYDFTNNTMGKQTALKSLPLLDSTIFKYDNKYWLFATCSGNDADHSELYIYYADVFLGQYKPHTKNPVKNNLNGSRPAGNVIKCDGNLYRPAQNCKMHYGASIAINKITKLSETDFSEELYFILAPEKNSPFNAGMHTINFLDDVIVVDGIRMLFKPWTKWKLFLKKILDKKLRGINL